MIWFTADTHWDHKNIIKYSNRPFRTVREMNQAILDNINSLVKENDELYHLGDFCFGPNAKYFRDAIKCKNVHIVWEITTAIPVDKNICLRLRPN